MIQGKRYQGAKESYKPDIEYQGAKATYEPDINYQGAKEIYEPDIEYGGAKRKSSTRAYVTINGTNIEETSYDGAYLKLTDYSIGSPTPLTKYIDVPGRPGMLDATLALNGKVNYTKRSISAKFHVTNINHEKFKEIMESDLLMPYQGQEIKLGFSFDENENWYYKGRFMFTGKMTSDISADVEMKSDNVFPYKLRTEKQVVSLSTTKTATVWAYQYVGLVTINCTQASCTVTYNGSTYTLVKGDNVIPELHLTCADKNYLGAISTMTFTGSGTITITYETGVL